jgi:hypothetical protein
VAAPWREEVFCKLNQLEDLLENNNKTKREIKSTIKDLAKLLRLVVVAEQSEQVTAPASSSKAVQVNFDGPSQEGNGQIVVVSDTTIKVTNGASLKVVYGGTAETRMSIPTQRRMQPQQQHNEDRPRQKMTVQQNTWRRVQYKKKRMTQLVKPDSVPERIIGETSKKKSDVTVLEVSGGGKSYADMVRSLKEKFGAGSETGFLAIRKNGVGNMVIHTKNPQEDTLSKIKEIEGLNVRRKMRRQYLLLRDIEITMEKDELEEILKKVTNNDDIKITSLRMAYGDTKRATFTVPEEVAKSLLSDGRVCVGLVRCRVTQLQELPRCYRCWRKGHTMGACKGPDRGNRCFRCGEEGHKVENCTNETKCLECDKNGHRTETCHGVKQIANDNEISAGKSQQE